jgi:hypothetical protein
MVDFPNGRRRLILMTNTMRINGTVYSVVKAGDFIVQLRGPRGGMATLVRNEKSPHMWAFQKGYTGAATWFRQSDLVDLPAKYAAPAPVAPSTENLARVAELEKKLAAAQKKSMEWAMRRGALPAGSTRARVTTANAEWARAAEHRDRIADALEQARKS